ncbi:hypothetical protein [Xanthomonas medicagonis]|uniref:hypothetical protein n=1 Tax=Xanthomonas medicagonis TaxID=3160841 RepID=UPI0035179C6E
MTQESNATRGLLERLRLRNEADADHGDQELQPANLESLELMTLSGKIRQLSPMLMERFKFCGRWNNANLDQDWLSVSDAANIGGDATAQEWIALRIENWDHCPPANVSKDDVALFGFNPYEPEETYVVWRTGQAEPEVWRFFGADYKNFRNLNRFLEYLVGDRTVDDSGRMPAIP